MKAKREHFDAVIIGAGISGLGVAGLLSREGRKVLVLGKNKFRGDRVRRHQG
ncbi:MAG: NAD(P)-binding protein [Proteobacteria bacterium]|nr:NAD(P)-binding protein [Pseudomonadota bacterium]